MKILGKVKNGVLNLVESLIFYEFLLSKIATMWLKTLIPKNLFFLLNQLKGAYQQSCCHCHCMFQKRETSHNPLIAWKVFAFLAEKSDDVVMLLIQGALTIFLVSRFLSFSSPLSPHFYFNLTQQMPIPYCTPYFFSTFRSQSFGGFITTHYPTTSQATKKHVIYVAQWIIVG